LTDAAKVRLRWSLLTLAAVALIGALVAAALFFGGFDTAADYPWPQPISWAIHRTMTNSVKVRARAVAAPERFTPAEVEAGFRLYDSHCAMCHGGPGLGRQPWTAGLEPTPPYLVEAARRWSRSEMFLIVHDGVRMTAMPAWRGRFSPGQTWDVVAFLQALPDLTARDYARMRALAGPSPAGEPRGGGAVPSQASSPPR